MIKKILGLTIMTATLIAISCSAPALDSKAKTPTITIWIHGSKTLPTTLYKLVGFDMPLGLHHANTLMQASHHPKRFIEVACKNTDLIDPKHFYLFGWPGALEPSLRKAEAQKLYTAIEQLIAQYKKTYGCTPVIRIITHSHGGNLALHLARVADAQDTCSFTIAELILLACPVWDANKKYVNHDIFERVYNLYSTADIIQCIDPQRRYPESQQLGNTPLFSSRIFDNNPKLTQTTIDCLFPTQHGMFLFRPVLPNLQKVKQLVDQEYNQGKNNTRIKIQWNPFTQWTDVRVA